MTGASDNDRQRAEPNSAASGEARPRIAVEDLMFGAEREVVVIVEGRVRELVLETPEPPVEEGVIGSHQTAEAVQVDGYRYLAFADGRIIYVAPQVDLRIEARAREP